MIKADLKNLARCMALALSLFLQPSMAQEPTGISRDQAIAVVTQHTSGKALKVSKKESSTGVIYIVKLLTNDGRIKLFRVDGLTGELR